jgi:hypothetical protein
MGISSPFPRPPAVAEHFLTVHNCGQLQVADVPMKGLL